MATPVAAVSSAPTFGGLTGYKRPALGRPTQVPSNLPAFRGKSYTTGSDTLKAPAIQNSKNRQDRGTNVTIPYARTCPIDHTCDLGRIARGDVVFTSRYQVDVSHIGHRKERVVGIDFLNKALGNDDSIKPPLAPINPNWVVGKTVLLGGNSDPKGVFDPLGSIMADNWREASFLRDWCCDGIVLSNDEPYAHTSNGASDVQQFNICVQGISSCNNGYNNFKGRGVEAYPRSMTERHGYGTEGTVAIGGVPYYPSYPMQMFDRKVKALSTLYVGLVATKRVLTAEIKKALLENSNLDSQSLNYQKLTDTSEKYKSFYTFKFVCFSDRAARQGALSLRFQDDWQYAEPPSKKQKPVHIDDVPKGSLEFDPFEPVSMTDYRGMVGAWKIGKVMDTAARRRDVYSGGPVDTAEQLTVNVCIEWCDWRKMRRLTNREDIGGYVSGAAMWLNVIAGSNKATDPSTQKTFYADADEGRIFQWPTTYVARASEKMDAAKDLEARRKNAPVNVDRDISKATYPLQRTETDQFNDYVNNAKKFAKLITDISNPIAVQSMIALAREKRITVKLSEQEVNAVWNAIARGADTITEGGFRFWFIGLDESLAADKKTTQAIFGTDDPSKIVTKTVERIWRQMTYFTNGQPKAVQVTKQMFVDFLLPENNQLNLPTKDLVTSIGDGMERAVDLIINHDIYMTGETGLSAAQEASAPSIVSKPKPASTNGKSGKKKASASAAPSTAAISAPESAFPAAVSKDSSAPKPAAKPAAKPASKPAAKNVTSTASTASTTAAAAASSAAVAVPSVASTSAGQGGAVAMETDPTSSAQVQATAAGSATDNSDIFSAIFGASSPSANAETDKSPSSGNPRSRVRRARDGR